jgi:hypothetical protein
MEEEVCIAAGRVTLEGRFAPGPDAGGVIITHPHPQYGGSMHNNVVWTAHLAFQARGWATLRFNFRGVGRSTGAYGQGLGEVEDLKAAAAFLAGRIPGPVFLAGYSFGAYVTARALVEGLTAGGALLIAPPVAFMDLAFLPEALGLNLVVAGDRDDLCPLAALQALLGRHPAPPELAVIAGADHFFSGREEDLFRALKDRAWLPPA